MNNIIRSIVILMMFVVANGLCAQAPEALTKDVEDAINANDSESLASAFYSNVEIVLPSKNGVYSRKQAEMVMKDFFANHPVSKFKVIHTGKKEKACFAIGEYVSNNSKFRFTFLTKPHGSNVLIHQLRIEKQDE